MNLGAETYVRTLWDLCGDNPEVRAALENMAEKDPELVVLLGELKGEIKIQQPTAEHELARVRRLIEWAEYELTEANKWGEATAKPIVRNVILKFREELHD